MHVTDVALLKHMKLYDCPKCIVPQTENYPLTQISEGCNHSLDCDDGCIAIQAMNRLCGPREISSCTLQYGPRPLKSTGRHGAF